MADSIPALTYPNRTHEATHADRLSVRARLNGLNAALATNCRLLEVGCAGGANLIGMAADLPDSEFLGIDISPREVAEATRLAARLRLTNVEFRLTSLEEIDESTGEFDFVVAHGVYSWVPTNVQQSLLAMMGGRLKPNGVAYLSYNTLPGWYSRSKARDLMSFHTRDIENPLKKVEQGLAVLGWLADTVGGTSPYVTELRAELDLLRTTDERYIFQEHFCHSSGAYFGDVAAGARRHGLQYFAESEQTATLHEALPEGARDLLAKISDPIRAEQYIDFLTDRRFRASLFCRTTAPRTLATLSVVKASLVTAACTVAGDAFDLRPTPLTVTGTRGTQAQITQPLLKIALGLLVACSPEPMAFGVLVDAVRARSSFDPADDARRLAFEENLGSAMARLEQLGFLRFHGFAPRVTSTPSARPLARALALEQASTDSYATTVWHETVHLSERERQILRALDGAPDAAAIAAACFMPEDEVVTVLNRLGRLGFLIA